MHMADALLSPPVATTLWAASGATLGWCSRRIRSDPREHLVPLMGVLGAFVFAAQMINFSIPATGSSGHIGGGLLLSILLGGPAAFIVIASVLTVQALLFADGGLLALGANIFNLGFFPCFVAYPLIYRPLIRRGGTMPSRRRVLIVTILSAVAGLQLGALGVVVETKLSGITSLPWATFLALMLPIHLAIGVVEGLATAVVIAFISKARPDLVDAGAEAVASQGASFPTRVIAIVGIAAAMTAGVLSWFASSHPDGLEWSISRITGKAEVDEGASAAHQVLAQLQRQVALLPDYKPASGEEKTSPGNAEESAAREAAWPAVDAGTSLAGVLGAAATLLLVSAIGYLLRPRRRPTPPRT